MNYFSNHKVAITLHIAIATAPDRSSRSRQCPHNDALSLSLSIGVQLSNENVFSIGMWWEIGFFVCLFFLHCMLFVVCYFYYFFSIPLSFFLVCRLLPHWHIISVSLNEWMSKRISRGYLFIYRHIHNTLRYKLNNKWLHNIDIVLDVPSWMLFIYASALNVLALFCFVWFRMVLLLLFFFFLLSMLFPAFWSAYESVVHFCISNCCVLCVVLLFSHFFDVVAWICYVRRFFFFSLSIFVSFHVFLFNGTMHYTAPSQLVLNLDNRKL